MLYQALFCFLICVGLGTSMPQSDTSLDEFPAVNTSWTTLVDVPTLVPTLSPDHDLSDLAHLVPNNTGSIFYSNNTTSESDIDQVFALMTANFTYPSVLLENSQYISNSTCLSDGLQIAFTDIDSRTHAKEAWVNATPFLAVTFNVSCGSSPAGQPTYWLVSDVAFNQSSLAVQLIAQEIPVKEAIIGGKISWGTRIVSEDTGTTDSVQTRGIFDDLIHDLNKSTNQNAPDSTGNITINLQPNVTADSKYWGQAYNIYQSVAPNPVELFCVGCSIGVQVHLAGDLDFTLQNGGALRSGNISLQGNLQTNFQLGVSVQSDFSQTFSQPIFSTGLPGFSLYNIIAIGPVVAMDVELTLSAHGKGRILLGASHEVASFHAQLDAANKSDAAVPSFQSGFKNTTFAASGQVGVEARFGLPLTIGVGIEITPLKFRKLLSLINEPFVDATATYQHDAQNATACNDGVAYELTLGDEVSMNFFDLSSMSLYKAQTPPLVKGCALLDG